MSDCNGNISNVKIYLSIVAVALIVLAGVEVSLYSKHASTGRPVIANSAAARVVIAPTVVADAENPKQSSPSVTSSRQAGPAQALAKSVGGLVSAAVNTTKELDGIGLSLTRLSAKEESQIGAEMHRRIMAEEREWENPAQSQRLQRLARPLLDQRSRKDIAYQIRLLDSDRVNAFSHAGGYLYLYRGLLKQFPSDAAIAMVLGHEIGHVDLRHCVQSIQYQAKLQKWSGTLADVAGFACRNLRTPYQKDQEFEADAFGFQAGRRAGWPREGLMQLLHGLNTMEMASEPTGTPALLKKINDFSRSHPYTVDRIQRLEKVSDSQ